MLVRTTARSYGKCHGGVGRIFAASLILMLMERRSMTIRYLSRFSNSRKRGPRDQKHRITKLRKFGLVLSSKS